MPLSFVVSQKGKRMLSVDGFLYHKHKINVESILWRCQKYDNCRCPGRAYTTSDKQTGEIVRVVEHNHAGNIAEVLAKKIVVKLKKKAAHSEDNTKAVVTRCLGRVPAEAAAVLPSIPSLHRCVQRVRAKNNPVLPTPPDRESLIIPGEFLTSFSDELFLLHDSGGKNRFLIFSTVKNLECLASCDTWFADGTFRSVPAIFLQLYSIHGRVNGKIIPLVYVLMPNKRKRTYISVLNILKEKEPRLNPRCVMVDFELSFISAVLLCFPGVILKGCHFHFGQSVYRHVQSDGKQILYGSDIDFATAVKMLIALAFVPINLVIGAFEDLCRSEDFVINNNVIGGIVSYFEATWIGRAHARGRSDPLFAINMWNCYDSVLNDEPRTNNSVEGWHHAFNSAIDRAHTSLGKFINVLRHEQSLTDVLLVQNNCGRSIRGRKRHRYASYDANLKVIISGFHDNDDVVDYLRRVASLIVL